MHQITIPRSPGTCDAYVITDETGAYQCRGCRITGQPASNGLRYGLYTARDEAALANHLHDHQQAGSPIPQHLIDTLTRRQITAA